MNIDLIIPTNNGIDLNVPTRSGIDLNINSTSGTTNYNNLTNKPSINDVTLIHNKTSAELGLQDRMDEITPQDIDNIIFG